MTKAITKASVRMPGDSARTLAHGIDALRAAAAELRARLRCPGADPALLLAHRDVDGLTERLAGTVLALVLAGWCVVASQRGAAARLGTLAADAWRSASTRRHVRVRRAF